MALLTAITSSEVPIRVATRRPPKADPRGHEGAVVNGTPAVSSAASESSDVRVAGRSISSATTSIRTANVARSTDGETLTDSRLPANDPAVPSSPKDEASTHPHSPCTGVRNQRDQRGDPDDEQRARGRHAKVLDQPVDQGRHGQYRPATTERPEAEPDDDAEQQRQQQHESASAEEAAQ